VITAGRFTKSIDPFVGIGVIAASFFAKMTSSKGTSATKIACGSFWWDDMLKKSPWIRSKFMTVEITKIKLRIADREIELTADEARQVQAELNKLFAAEKSTLEEIKADLEEIKNRPNIVNTPMPYPVYPPCLPPAPSWPLNPPWTVGDPPIYGPTCISGGSLTCSSRQ